MRWPEDEWALLKKAGYSTRLSKHYLALTNFGFIENPDVAQDYWGPCGDIIKLARRRC
jgi:hypothetical protein